MAIYSHPWTTLLAVSIMVDMKRPRWLRYEDPFSYGRPIRFKQECLVGAILAAVGAVLFVLEIVWLLRSSR